jgi:putative ABC transport system permease protein
VNLLENISLAIAGLRAGKMRALLTMLGIIIGIGAVIGIVTIGGALTGTITGSMQTLGVGNIIVSMQSRKDNVYLSREDKISDKMLAVMRQRFEGEIEAISITENGDSGVVRDGRREAKVSTVGANSDYPAANNLTLQQGRFISVVDNAKQKKVAVVSDKLVGDIFAKNENPLGREIKVYSGSAIKTYVIIGVYKYERSLMNVSVMGEGDTPTDMYVPLDLVRKERNIWPGYTYFTVTAKQGGDAKKLTQDIIDFFDRYYHNNVNYTVSAFSMESMIAQMSTIMNTVSIAISVIAAISLLVGGIGVMNIMLVSVTERTREIGTRKALGARNGAIRLQFIVESVIICLIGGVIGIVFGIILGNVGAALLGARAALSMPAVAIAVVFSSAIGIFFGYYPANKAARLDPIEALRYE